MNNSENESELERLDEELRDHQQRLAELQRQQEEVERRRRELENLNERRQKVITGQRDLKDCLTESLELLEHVEHDLKRNRDYVQSAHKGLSSHLQVINQINPADWQQTNLQEQLHTALRAIEDARVDFEKVQPKLDSFRGKNGHAGHWETATSLSSRHHESEHDAESEMQYPSFLELVRRGLAFTFPLLIILLLIALVFFFKS